MVKLIKRCNEGKNRVYRRGDSSWCQRKKFELGRLLDAPGLPRKEESYIVCVGPRPGSRAKPKYYWPRVNNLRHLHDDK
jgi:hypothetical protein